MQPHRIPRQVHMDHHRALLLQVDTFTTRLGGDEKAHVSRVEHPCGMFA